MVFATWRSSCGDPSVRKRSNKGQHIVLQTLKSRLGTPWVLVLNDDGEQTSYDASYFRKLKEVANGEVKS